MFKAQCLCGANRLRISDIEPRIAHCHCHMCQKFHGAAFSTFVEVKLDNLDWPNEYNATSEFQAENFSKRSFCKICGSSLSFESQFNRKSRTIEIALAAFDQESQNSLMESIGRQEKTSDESDYKVESKPKSIVDCHIYLESKAPWLDINDDLRKFDRYRE